MQIAKIYRSQPTSCALTTAVGYCGDMQIELIRLNNDAACKGQIQFVPPA